MCYMCLEAGFLLFVFRTNATLGGNTERARGFGVFCRLDNSDGAHQYQLLFEYEKVQQNGCLLHLVKVLRFNLRKFPLHRYHSNK